MSKIFLKAISVWLLMLLAAILNGVVREKLIIPALGDLAGRVVSSVTLSLFIFVITLIVIPWFRITEKSGFWMLWVFWTALTVAFELSFGRFRGVSWGTLLADYNLLKGRIWVLVLITTLISSVVAAKIRGIPKKL